jgi:prevent-host-death family protein
MTMMIAITTIVRRPPMQRTVSAQAARQRLGELLEGVYYRGDEVVIERAGKPMGVVISPERYAAMQAARDRFWEKVDEIREQNRGVDPNEVERDVGAAVEAVRRAKRETSHRKSETSVET